METQLLSPTLANRIYKESAIQIGTFLGGPFVAGYLIAANYKQLGELENAKKTWIWTIISFFAFVLVVSFVPDSVPNAVFTVVNTAIVTVLVQKFQGAKIKAHIEGGGGLYKTSRAALIGLCCGLLFIALALGLYFIGDAFLQ